MNQATLFRSLLRQPKGSHSRGSMAKERKGFTVTWRIENFSFCPQKKGEALTSPAFLVHTLNWTRWRIRLYPRSLLGDGYMDLYLDREALDAGPDDFGLDLELSLLARDGSPLKSKETYEDPFRKGSSSSPLTVSRDEVLLRRGDSFLPQDVLTVRCRMWNRRGSVPKSGRCTARTRIRVERTSFVGFSKNFSSLEPGAKRTLETMSASTEKQAVTLNIFLTESQCCGGSIWIQLIPAEEEDVKYCTCRLFLLDTTGKKTECVRNEILFLGNEPAWQFPLHLTKRSLVERKKHYLPNDFLFLRCELAFSTGVEYQKIEDTEYKTVTLTEEKTSGYPSVQEDLTTLYQGGILADTKLRTATETFAAHRNILSARSAVFRAMFTSNMRERTTDCVDIKDLDADTVRRMLIFLYSDTLDVDLEWEGAKGLYSAADKYEILSLKGRCSSFLKGSVQLSNCCDILVLADMHQDEDLKRSVQDYILGHDQKVLHTAQWRNLEKNHSRLTIETLRMMYLRNRCN